MSLRGEWKSGSSPTSYVNIGYTETGRTGTTATYRVEVKMRLGSSQSFFGYNLYGTVNINGVSQEIKFKDASPSWSGTTWRGPFVFTITAPAGTGGGTLPASFSFRSTQTSYSYNTGNKTVSLSTWNTAPYWTTDDANVNGWKEHKIIPENTAEVTVNFPGATDREGNTIYKDAYRYVNDSNTGQPGYGVTGSSFTDNLSSYGMGSVIKYKMLCHDGLGAWSEERWTWTYTKNTLTGANISCSDIISYNTERISIYTDGAKNTNGNTNFTYELSSPQIKIYNNNPSGNFTLHIKRGNEAVSGPYILFEDLKNLFRNSGWIGNIQLQYKTMNAYGSNIIKSVNINVDLRVSPIGVSSLSMSGGHTISNTQYYIPSVNDITLSWSPGRDLLGGSVTYDIQQNIDNKGFTTIAADLVQSTNSFVVKHSNIDRATKCKYRIITKTNFGFVTNVDFQEITLHYYNSPTINVTNINRTATEIHASIAVTTNTSIAAVAIKSMKYSFKGKDYSFAANPYQMTVRDLTETETGEIIVTCSDSSALPNSTVIYKIPISTYIPIVSIRKKGLGVNTFATDEHKFAVKGKSKFSGDVDLAGNINVTNKASLNGGALVSDTFGIYSGQVLKDDNFDNFLSPGEYQVSITNGPAQNQPTDDPNFYGKLIVNVSNGEKHNNSDNWIWQTLYSTDSYTYRRFKVNNNPWQHWVRDLKQQRRLHSADGSSADNFASGQTFCYANVPGASTFSGPMISFGGLDGKYDCQIKANYTEGGNQIAFRTRDGDMDNWNPWRHFVTTELINEYWGLRSPDGSSGWMRVPQTGLLPYASGGSSSSLGSFYWPFRTIYGKNIYSDQFTFNTIAGDAAYMKIDTVSQETRLDIVVADDENDKIRLVNDHWNDRYKLLLVTCKDWTEVYNSLWVYGACLPDGNGVSGWHLGGTSNRWHTLYCVNSPNISSDANTKENIVYIDDTPSTLSLDEGVKYPFKNFIKEDFKAASYNYKKVEAPGISQDGEEQPVAPVDYNEEHSKQIGFIAQDIEDTAIGQTFVYKDENGTLSYSLGGYVTVVAKALQEEIREKDKIIEELQNKIKLIEERLDLLV